VLGDVVWDLSAFAQGRPGGAVLMAVAGQDATAPFLAVQCAEDDAVLALRHGCPASCSATTVGGRQIDTARSGIEVLPEVMASLRKEPGYTKESFQVFFDGGVRCATDVFKALALGATAVGVGRPSVYSLAAFVGQPGV
jgi:L-lactate dehydrogenase (cytochrome)